MPPSSPRTLSDAPTLVRLLACLGEAEVRAAPRPLADRLSQWLGWTDAVTLSSVLGAPAPAAADGARANDGAAAQQRCLTLRAALVKAITADAGPAPVQAARHGTARASGAARVPQLGQPVPAPAADFTVYRRHYLALQQMMDSDIGDLRAFLRGRLAASSPALARLAILDAAMERALAARERSLFGAVPDRLAADFERLRRAAPAARDDGGPADHASAPFAWLDWFRKDLQRVLLAELEVRFQPVEGLLAALRAR